MTDLPSPASLRITAKSAARSVAVSLAVGSSKTTTRESWARTFKTWMSCRAPTVSSSTGRVNGTSNRYRALNRSA
ncbi:hypothetical protein LUX33_23275 [Actinomadura madurae]|uniref:hypothetical protein n=1 Tax=Actinomadura madurae TaxID=1993 RepID=UPI0020D24BAE|nr:hypothetical protein [Actinomadura madurae]MCP9951048.1 hypothetical protein [Actinomadura madurae]MCP9967830.1 hypothetical protein [Actinomadura madurae]